MKNTNPAAESGAFIRRARGYSVVQNEALFNDRLSMSAKGLYALISARIDYTAVPLTKQWLMNHCTEGERAFNRAWDMLKNNGYLVAHVRLAKHGRFCYEYELRDSNNGWNGVYLIYYDAQGRVKGIRAVSDELCRENRLSVVETDGHGKAQRAAPLWHDKRQENIYHDRLRT